ncbi:MAG: CDP-diacylglycerol--glycerol-3-phosphate 3-phosphatidyltransferase [Gammaproteobacteria bacterium]|nr:CDP-diacylglycerol--glycerol-3-phosphate 3-phosphatidyltransferase [Gammaproteobacteria bacterium]NNF60460.1 CDP-diacylglycerol--glycerol-3-phosphate 3-phosphatidyltransferase [Gammaproteobacteria bacterium]
MALIPLFVVIFFFGEWGKAVSALLFLLAGLTDWLDGYLARRLNQTSHFGAFLDPVADKLIVSVALILIVFAHDGLFGAVVAISSAIIVGREIAVSAIREWMALLGARQKVAVVAIGKIKTIVQVIAIFLLLYRRPIAGVEIYEYGVILLLIAAALTLWSMFVYLRAAWPAIVDPEAVTGAEDGSQGQGDAGA